MSEAWIRDTGIVFALVFLLIGFKAGTASFVISALFLLVVLLAPALLKPLARLWLAVTEVLGKVMNRIFFSTVFFIVIIPVGYIRRIVQGDGREFEKQPARASAFIAEERNFSEDIFNTPF